MSAIANNIANVNTTGFKRDRVMFQDLFYQTQEAPGAMLDQNNIMPTGLQFGSGVRIVGTQKTFTEGNIETTDNAMNVAIMGQGLLQVQKANGDIAYTRDGNLQVNADGDLTRRQRYHRVGATDAGQLRQPGGAFRRGRQSVPGNRCQRSADRRRTGRRWAWHLAGQRAGRLQRRYRQRNGGDDHGATRVRDERQNGVGCGRYVAVHQPDAVRRHVGCDADALPGTISEWTVHIAWLINR